MARKKSDVLSEEQKALQEVIKQQQRDQLAADAAVVPEINNSPTASPEQLDEVSVVAERPKPAPASEVPNAETWRQDKLAADIAASAPTINLRPAEQPIELREATVVADRNQPSQADSDAEPGTPVSIGQQMLERDRAASNNPTPTLEAPADLDATRVDPYVSDVAKAYREEQKSFADYVLSLNQELKAAEEEAKTQVKNDYKSARWTGLTELAASIANMIGVGEGNAVSQQYKTYSHDWMQKADQSMREHRSRIDNLRQRQRENEYKMAQLKSKGGLAVAKAKRDAEAQKALAEYRRAQAALQNAKTESERAKALRDAETAVAKMELMGAQTSAYYAQVGLRDAQAQAALMNAASRQSAVENQNKNRDSRTAAQNDRDYASADKARGTTSAGRSGRSSADLIKDL